MKSVLNIVAAVLIAAGLVVAVASLLTPGQVILGIDFKLAATLVIGGLILLALAKALALLERMSNDLRQLRKAGSEAPPWLRQAAGQSGIQAAAALALAEGAAPAEFTRQGPGSEPAQEVGQDIGDQAATAEAEWPQATETSWPEASDERWPGAPEPERHVGTPDPAREEETELAFLDTPSPARQAEFGQQSDSGPELEPETEPEPAEVAPEDYPEEPSEPQPADSEAVPVWEHAEMPRRLKPSQYTPWSPEEPAEAPEEAEPAEDWEQAPDEQEQFFEADAPEAQAPEDLPPEEQSREEQWREDQSPEDQSPEDQSPEEQPPEEQPPEEQPPDEHEQASLYVVEERMFRGKQARVLSDGTVEAETAEGWMRFEDFDHLEEYLDAMAELGR